jgi:multicomponent Na+:H+ antiporter subunit E
MTRHNIFWRRGVPLLLLYLLLWWVLTGGDRHSWLIGSLAVGLALLVSLSIPTPQATPRFSPAGLLRFILYFLGQSIRGGSDVAYRAFSPRLPLDPALLDYPLQLPPGSARIFLLNTVSLLPGTLSADLIDDTLRVHLLDQQRDPQLQQLEQRVAGLFSLRLEKRS